MFVESDSIKNRGVYKNLFTNLNTDPYLKSYCIFQELALIKNNNFNSLNTLFLNRFFVKRDRLALKG